jgi:hypothetical protein
LLKTRPLVQDTTVGFGLITYCIEDRTGVYRKAGAGDLHSRISEYILYRTVERGRE